MQKQLKEKGHPWEKCKAFDNSAVVGKFIPYKKAANKKGNIEFTLLKNGKICQKGNSKMMLTPIDKLISYASKFFTLQKDDLVFTGTPEGVGPMNVGDTFEGFIGK